MFTLVVFLVFSDTANSTNIPNLVLKIDAWPDIPDLLNSRCPFETSLYYKNSWLWPVLPVYTSDFLSLPFWGLNLVGHPNFPYFNHFTNRFANFLYRSSLLCLLIKHLNYLFLFHHYRWVIPRVSDNIVIRKFILLTSLYTLKHQRKLSPPQTKRNGIANCTILLNS